MFLTISFICLLVLPGFARQSDDPVKKAVTQLDKWTANSPVEKVYLQMDKPYYAAGESMWFKAYVTIGTGHRLSGLSKILYVELIDGADSVKRSLRLPVYSGIGWGDIKLPDNLVAGSYRLRAYTNYMRNAGDGYFFDRTITIGNGIQNNVFTNTRYKYTTQNAQQKVNAMVSFTNLAGTPYANKEVSFEVKLGAKNVSRGKGMTDGDGMINIAFINPNPAATGAGSGQIVTNLKLSDKNTSTQTLVIKALSDKADVQFFPEGGNLVNGVRSKVAFKATGPDGLGATVTGVITDNEHNEIAKLNNQHAGMGLFALLPQAGKTYQAQITNADGSVNTIPLPKAEDNGYVLSVTGNDPDQLILKVSTNPALSAQQNEELSVIGQQNGKVLYAVKSKLTDGYFATEIPKSKFPSGMVQFTLFNAKGEPLNERLSFIRHDDQLRLNVSTAKESYAPRQKVTIGLEVKDKDGKPSIGAFSASVTDESKVPVDETTETSIFSYLLLSSDLKGYIEKPNYYFTANSEQTRADLDLLLLTQGYRRFAWKQILADQYAPVVYQPQHSIVLSGTVKTNSGKPVPKGKITLMATKGGMFLLDTVADEQGRFAFSNLMFGDSVMFVVQGRTARNGKNVEIEMDKETWPAVRHEQERGRCADQYEQ
jgi:hypothetical protein